MRTRVTPQPAAAMRHAALLAATLIGLWLVLIATTFPRHFDGENDVPRHAVIATSMPAVAAKCGLSRQMTADALPMPPAFAARSGRSR